MIKKNNAIETLYSDFSFVFNIDKVIYKNKTEYQDLLIFENNFFGRVMMLDGITQLTTRDEFIYHEMMVHVPILSLDKVGNVLIIGGGDGGIARECLKHKSIKSLTQVEIDHTVVDMSIKYFPQVSSTAYLDPRLELIIDDGVKYIKETSKKFDVIIVDSTDPEGPGSILFSEEFYKFCSEKLTENGILVTQNGVPFMQSAELKQSISYFKNLFNHATCYLATIPSYIGGFMAMGFATNNKDALNIGQEEIIRRFQKANIQTKYYNPEIHLASFKLPNFIKDIVLIKY